MKWSPGKDLPSYGTLALILAVSTLCLCACNSGGSGGSDAVVTATATDEDTVVATEAVDTATEVIIPAADAGATALEALGEKLFFDVNLSSPAGQSCASCHAPEAAFTDPDTIFPVSEGVISGRFGNRNTPTAAYAAHIPEFGLGPNGNGFIGGQFLDGRASTLEDQAQGPFLNPLEMNNPDRETVIESVRLAEYANDFEAVFGAGALDNVETAYLQIATAIAAFERTGVFSPFSSKFDAVQRGDDVFTVSEQRGFNLFNGRALCDRCHITGNNAAQVFSNFTYENIGVPANPNNPFYNLDASLNPDGAAFVDTGLGGVLNDPAEDGKFRVPTLRNIDETGPYMHNGVFTTLGEVVDFYNTRDINPNQALPEVAANVNRDLLGNLNLDRRDIDDLISFLQTLSDGHNL